MMNEMKPCPFCGFEAKLLYTDELGRFRATCYNEDCGCSLPPWVLFEKDEDVMEKVSRAIMYWNKRVSRDEQLSGENKEKQND